MLLSLGHAAPHLELRFRILSSSQAQTWARLLEESLEAGGIQERDRFVNFHPNAFAERDEVIEVIRDTVGKLQKLHPNIEFGELDFSNIQKEVNRLHVNFADRHLVFHDLSAQSLSLWDLFNVKLHQLESVARRQAMELGSGIRNAYLNVSFSNSRRVSLKAEDFREGVLYRNFGVCYLGYCQVGRHISELYFSKDRGVPKEHIQPFQQMGPDFRIWFGHNQGQKAGRELVANIEKWFREDESGKFAELGLQWDHNALGIPHIPVAALEEMIFSEHKITELQDQVHAHRYVSGIQLLTE